MLVVSGVAFFVGRRRVTPPIRKTLDTTAKAVFTVVGILALLRHPIDVGEKVHLPIYEAIARYIGQVTYRRSSSSDFSPWR